MTQAEFDLIEEESQIHKSGSRTASAALLAWFLTAVWRVEPEDVSDAICDGSGDLGIDGMVVDDDLREIVIFQAKHNDRAEREMGDTDLKRLVGSAVYFASPEAVDSLMRSRPNAELRNLIARQEVRKRIADGSHVTRLVMVTNANLNQAGTEYVGTVAGNEPSLEVWDRARLAPVAERTKRPELRPDQLVLQAAAPPTALALNSEVEMAVALVTAEQLASLPGIDDLSVFDRNVRLGLGRTRINRELAETVGDTSEHVLFPAYHNGLTLLTNGLSVNANELRLDGITVVNGCQSLRALHDHRAKLTPELRVLVKVVKLAQRSTLSDIITYRTNNQNPVDIRDQRSTDAIQRDLQAQVERDYRGELAYEIREGEQHTARQVLDNQHAAQLIMAIYVKEPWNAVRKVRLFDEDYRRIFNRAIDSHRLYLVHLIGQVVDDVRPSLRPELQASFASVRLSLAYLLAEFLRQSQLGNLLLEEPQRWVPEAAAELFYALQAYAQDIATSINVYIEQEREKSGEDFDAKIVFKSAQGIRPLAGAVRSHTDYLSRREKEYLFGVQPVR